MFVGWDWASTTHDVTVIDNAGRIVDRWAPEHTETGLDQTLAVWPATAGLSSCRWPSSGPVA